MSGPRRRGSHTLLSVKSHSQFSKNGSLCIWLSAVELCAGPRDHEPQLEVAVPYFKEVGTQGTQVKYIRYSKVR